MKVGYYQKEFLIKLLKTVIFFLIGLLFLAPLLWMLSSSLKTPAEVFARDFKWIPEDPRWENYVTVWTDEEVSMARGYINSTIISAFSIAGGVLFASLAAYAFAKLQFRGKNLAFSLLLATMMMPGEVTLIPRFMMFYKMGLYNNLWAVILPHWFAPGAIFMLRQFYYGIPDELMEAAKIDGASHLRIFGQIMMPLTKAAIASQCVLSFVSCWNDYLAPLIYLVKKELYTISQVVQWQMMDEISRTDLLMASASCAIIPVVIVFFLSQRFFIEGIATAGVKG